MPLSLPRKRNDVPLVRENGLPTQTDQQWWDRVASTLETSFNALEDAIAAIAAAQAAADAANAAAAAADAAAADAQTAADAVTDAQELGSSYVSGVTITASDAGSDVSIVISAHTRKYPQPDGSTVDVAVNGDTLTGRSYSTTYYVYYDDAARTGGAVSYQTTTSNTTAAQIGDRHLVGAVATPAAAGAPIDGVYTNPPGVGTLDAI